MIERIEQRAGGVAEVIALLGVSRNNWYRWRRSEAPLPPYIEKSIRAHLAADNATFDSWLPDNAQNAEPKIVVWWSYDFTRWAVTQYDEGENHVGDTEYHRVQNEAVKSACMMATAAGINRVEILTKVDNLKKRYNAADIARIMIT